MQVLAAALQRVLADGSDAPPVDLLIEHAALERRPLVSDHEVASDRLDLEVILGMTLVVLLAVGATRARLRRHEDPGPGSCRAVLPRALAARDAAMEVELLGGLAEVPDIAGRVLAVPVERVLDEVAVLEDAVMDYARTPARDGPRVARDAEDLLDRDTLVGTAVAQHGARLQRIPRVRHVRRNVRGPGEECGHRQRGCEHHFMITRDGSADAGTWREARLPSAGPHVVRAGPDCGPVTSDACSLLRLALAVGLAGLQVTAGDDGAGGQAVCGRRHVHVHRVALGRIGAERRRFAVRVPVSRLV